jgi:hypothetical protein
VFPVRYKLNLYMLYRRKWTASVIYWSEFLAKIQRSRVRFPALADFLGVVGLERGPLSFVSTIKELLGRKNDNFYTFVYTSIGKTTDVSP